MNWKLVFLGGFAMYVVMLVVSFATGPLIHTGVLEEAYVETNDFWRPELRQDPPDTAALMPRWIVTGLLTTFVIAAIYGCVHTAFSGPGWRRGLIYGLILSALMCCSCAGWSGIFNLPGKIWIWWGAESFLYYLPGGALLGLLNEKFFG